MERVYWGDAASAGMERACSQARATFGLFWREVYWEQRRIVPAYDLVAVKAVFHGDRPEVHPEQMWVGDVAFDGKTVSGTLMNEPNEIRGLAAGDLVQFGLDELTDWLLAADGRALGGYTIQVLRAGMRAAARAEHDAAWGLAFGDPSTVGLPPSDAEHPLAEHLSERLEAALAADPTLLTTADDQGLLLLHRLALAGTPGGVQIALAHGARRDAPAGNGLTALDLARALRWHEVERLLA